MKSPIVVVNFKTYSEATGKNALNLARKLENISKEIIVCAQPLDAQEIREKTKLKKVYGQHVDYFEQGKNTGFATIEEFKSQKISGSLLNHSEHRIGMNNIAKTIKECEKRNFQIIVCVENNKEAKEVLKLGKIKAIALEIKELISSGKSITEYRKDEVVEFAKIIKKSKRKVLALCGAGISSAEDINEAIKCGCDGVLIASAIVKSKNPSKILGNFF